MVEMHQMIGTRKTKKKTKKKAKKMAKKVSLKKKPGKFPMLK
jgi:hypothetical protein